MSALGHKRTFAVQKGMSALPPKATLNAFIRMSASAAPNILNDLRVLIRRCRIKTAFNTLRDKGIELRVRHTLHNYGVMVASGSFGISDATRRTNSTG